MLKRKSNSRTFLHSTDCVPQHIAFIMDGNRRYAQRKGKEATWGHTVGVSAVENLLHWTYLAKIKHITIYAFSTENFKRDPAEVERIFDLLEKMLYKLSTDEKILSKKIKIRMIGETDNLPEKTLKAFKDLEEKTAGNDKMYLNVALAYGGRNDITQAFEKIAEDVVDLNNSKNLNETNNSNKTKEMKENFLSDDEISKYLFPFSDEVVPGVDFLIRTGDEHRTSNFLPWQANGNNAIVCYYNKFWPEFTFKDLFYVLRIYRRMEEERARDEARRLKKVEAFLAAQND
ncbi:Isoprenyl transferase [Methanimicrococcus hongohii]|uniref:Tritrans,polycis-undecaprenyl-diphosphate synthase (geranylgeranyl-diphosphate specific) n=1 Tax=Methanimicrococcus hongohii TaxID=3028295 RepID=A0AA96ZTN4_9EURY|nr:polyprenyl diphosphate synthase [Methanimicrococcus sp. Hf6]WNY22852.1 Isoprenyl transferase [Methanimicrococcus sp. Hf6]